MENQANVDRRDVDSGESVSGSSDGEVHVVKKEVVMMPRGRAQPPRAVPPFAMVPECGLTWLMLSPHIWLRLDLQVESIKKNIFEYKRYSQKCPCPGRCSDSFWRSTWILCAVNPAKK